MTTTTERPRTQAEARALLEEWGREQKHVEAWADIVAQFAYCTGPARFIMEEHVFKPRELMARVAEQFADASAELLEAARELDLYEEACKLVGGVREANKIMLEMWQRVS